MSHPQISRPDEGNREALLSYQKSLDCIHCGLCLSVCPTYGATGDEAASPRGRIYLMRGLAEGRLEQGRGFQDKMDLCLMCRACESVCPSAVQFGTMMEITRHEGFKADLDARSAAGRRLQRFLLRRVVPSPRLLGFLVGATRLMVRSGMIGLLRRLGISRRLPATLRAMEASIPEIPAAHERRPLPPLTPAAPGATPRGRVALLEGCVMPALFGAVNRRTAEALAAQGYEVVSPAGQTCCGALQAHAGDLDCARELARRNLEVFADPEIRHVVMNSAGCGAAMAEYGHWFADDPALAEKARLVAAKVIDVLELFAREGLEPRGLSGPKCVKATYDAPCHLHHARKVTTDPLTVLARTPGIDLVSLPGAADCCGAAGIYNLTHAEMSRLLLEKKLDQLASTGASLLLTGNPGCLLQWKKGIEARGLKIEVRHPVELL